MDFWMLKKRTIFLEVHSIKKKNGVYAKFFMLGFGPPNHAKT